MSRLPAVLPDPAYAALPGNIPPEVNSPAWAPLDTGGAVNVDPLTGNAGTLTESPATAGKRKLANDVPWDGPPSSSLRKLTHFRSPGMGDAMWSGSCRYDLAGASPSYSDYDDPSTYSKDDGLTYSITGGIVKGGDRLDVGEPTATRGPRVAAYRDSAPAAAFFQGYFNPRWSGLLAGFRPVIAPRPLHANFNPGQMGSKELHRATQYQPVPPMGSIVGYFGTEKAL